MDLGRITDLDSGGRRSGKYFSKCRRTGMNKVKELQMEGVDSSDDVNMETFDEFDFMRIFRVPLMLFFLTIVSVAFVGIFGKESLSYKEDILDSACKFEQNYKSFIWNISGKLKIKPYRQINKKNAQ